MINGMKGCVAVVGGKQGELLEELPGGSNTIFASRGFGSEFTAL